MHKLTISVLETYREGYNAINISAIPHHKTTTILTATADEVHVLEYIAEDLQKRWCKPLNVSIEKVSYKPGLNAAMDAAEEWLKQNTSRGGE